MYNPLIRFFAHQPFVVMDGALATELERLGADLNDPLWSAKVLLEQPDLIEKVYEQYLEAGSDMIATMTYQASYLGFAERGLDQKQSTGLFDLSVDLATSVRDQFWSRPAKRKGRQLPMIVGSLGPYGAHLADGSEYSGNYDCSIQELMDWHRPQVAAICHKGVEMLLFETVPSIKEARAILTLMKEFPKQAVGLSFSCRDEQHISHGEKLVQAFSAIEGAPQLIAMGINCTAPDYISPLLNSVQGITSKPIMVYPNSGEIWNAEQHCWQSGKGKVTFHNRVREWYANGARIIGGCCRTNPDQIRKIREEMQKL